MEDNRRAMLIAGAASLFLATALLIVYFLAQVASRQGKYPVSIDVLPEDSSVIINGKEVSGKEIYLEPGSYNYIVKRDHFYDESGSIQVIDSDNQSIIAPLSPSDETGRSIYNDLSGEYIKLEGRAGELAEEEGERFTKENPITSELPYTTPLYTIGYRSDNSKNNNTGVILTIHAKPGYYNNAITQIRNFGYNPAEFKIDIVGEENPFK